MGGEKGETSIVGCKVLPICDTVSVGSDDGYCGEAGDQKIEGRKSEKRGGIARMKELIKWATSTTSSKSSRVGFKSLKVLKTQNRDSSDQRSSTSSKMNMIWELGSSSSVSSAYSNRTNQILVKNLSNLSSNLSNLSQILPSSDANHLNKMAMNDECVKMSQWITTDSDFVVLEL